MKAAAILLVFIVSLLGAYAFGVKSGAQSFMGYDSPYRAALAVANLRRLQSGDVDGLKDALEFDVDSYIYAYGTFGNPTHSWAFPELSDPASVDSAMRHVVLYRSSNPSPSVGEAVLQTLSQEEREQYEEQERVINDVLASFELEE